MSEKKIPLLITGGMPEYLMENILTDGYEMKHIEDPTDAQLAAAEVIVGFPPVPRLSVAANLKWLQIPWSGADGYADHPDFPAHVTLTNATGAFQSDGSQSPRCGAEPPCLEESLRRHRKQRCS